MTDGDIACYYIEYVLSSAEPMPYVDWVDTFKLVYKLTTDKGN